MNNTWSILYDFQKDEKLCLENQNTSNDLCLFNMSNPNIGFWFKNESQLVWKNITGWKSLAAGYSHTCGITDEDTILCWGQGKNQQSLLPQWIVSMHENLQWKAISCGTSHTCAILKNGSAACWGSNVEGQISIPPQVAAWEMIDCGYAHTCGIDVNGSAYCWGWDGITPGRLIPFGQTKVPSDISSWRSIAAGFVHSCGVASNGEGRCWGSNGNDQISMPSYLESAASQEANVNMSMHFAIQEPSRWESITASYFHSCGLTVNKTIM
uniref:Uncharacterized protein n=1 Tax=Guillardia theta TaxID=55529 RepID=A0A7S4H8L8_GUITH|mmetsp:Transcript_10606/g.35486  ORF Transcript_10606/g.35486 Transcript_10606/m.35486 type:complete len:268 (+) Transcript_10606:307-1110(+)